VYWTEDTSLVLLFSRKELIMYGVGKKHEDKWVSLVDLEVALGAAVRFYNEKLDEAIKITFNAEPHEVNWIVQKLVLYWSERIRVTQLVLDEFSENHYIFPKKI